ncbi:MAG: hypothetical protein DMF69_14025 [Acidobacteria bacterium]|nr:MAG: hypothetical protein DMF69_14025 [Acidobacteriota bacterium]
MKLGAAGGALQQILDPADGNHRDDEEESDEEHSLLLFKAARRAAISAAPLTWVDFRTPREEMRADDKEAEHGWHL